MSYRIDLSTCIGCGVCADECPRVAVMERDGIYQIDVRKCNDCGQCKAVCPVEAIIGSKVKAERG
jgi:formate hydrogenlyase subunit 6/NADH:ubiquinone oxidoreductase subunit I